jgi:hypothetical protein
MSTVEWIAFTMTWAVVILIVIVLAGVLRYLGTLQTRIGESVPRTTVLERGDRVPAFQLTELHGGSVVGSDQIIGTGTATILLLLTATCTECEVIAKQIGELTKRPGGLPALRWSIVIAWYGDRETIQERARPVPPNAPGLTILHDPDARLARDLLVGSLPIGIALDGSGRVVGQTANPGPNWLYLTLGAAAPDKALEPGWVSEITVRG